jgi:hypothetical protein
VSQGLAATPLNRLASLRRDPSTRALARGANALGRDDGVEKGVCHFFNFANSGRISSRISSFVSGPA